MDEAPDRGFTLSHQRVILDIDFFGVINATAHLTIHPTSHRLRTLYLHASPLLQISGVNLSSPVPSDPLLPTPASYALTQPFQPYPARDPPLDIKAHPEIKRKTWVSSSEKDEGELAISVSGGWVRITRGEDGQPAGLAPIHVQVDYRLVVGGDVVEGIVFNGGGDNPPHMYLSPTTYDAARIWTPCVDSLWERCTWELEFIVPRYLEGGEDYPVMVVSSGELMEQITHPHSPNKTIFYYLQTNPTSVQHISFAAGPFEMHEICEAPKPILGFCLPGDRELLTNSTAFLPRAMSFYSTEYGLYPFTEYKVVFVASPRLPCSTSATLAVCSSDLLYPPNIIDQAFTTRQTLALSLIQQWVGINIIQRSLADTWIIHGLALYVAAQFLRHLLGNNEYRFRLKKDIEKCARLDQGDQWPICVPGILDPPDIDFINLKAPLVLHILDRHLVKAGTSLGLSRVIPRIFLSALSDELTGNTLSTQSFFRTCRKISNMDLTSFQDQWVFGSGCPHILVQSKFVRKKFTIELQVEQRRPAHHSKKRPTQLFEGSLTVRIHEADGAPFEHLVEVKQDYKVHSLPFNTKYKRTRRSGHIAARFNKLQADLEETNEAADEAQLQDVDRSEVFAYPPWDDEAIAAEWRVADWNERQATEMIGESGGYEWMRIDPEVEWIASFEILEKEWYWQSQLRGERDVVAQLEAINHFARLQETSPVIASELVRTVLVKNYYYRVRMEAAQALVKYSTQGSDYLGHFLLLKLFQHLYSDSTGDPTVEEIKPRRNEFSDLADYFVKQSIVSALGLVRDPHSLGSWREVRQFLLNLLKQNDNTGNRFSDANYLATVVAAVGNAFSSTAAARDRDPELTKQAMDAVDRTITMDRLVPSYQNVVTEAGLQTMLKFVVASHKTNDARLFLSYTRDGNCEPLRIAAFDCLAFCKPPHRSATITMYLLDVIQNDSSLIIRRHVARLVSEAILVSLALGEVIPTQSSIIDNDLSSTAADAVSEAEKAEAAGKAIIRLVRKEFVKKVEMKEGILDLLTSNMATTDPLVRLALIRAAENMSTSQPEALPKTTVILHTPQIEVAPALPLPTPRLKISLGTPVPKAEQEDYGFPEVTPPIKLVLNPKKKVLKAQSKGLSQADLIAIRSALNILFAHRSSTWFRVPVDPIRDNVPLYPTLIKQPMDLSTAQAKIDNGMYSTRQEFADDMRLIANNCKTFNLPRTPIYNAAEGFEAYFEKVWAKTEATINTVATGQSQSSQPSRPAPVAPPPAARLAPIPPAPAAIKLKVISRPKPVETGPTPMAPPPIPVNRKSSLATSQHATSTEPTKKRKEAVKSTGGSGLDDLLGAEVDAISRAQPFTSAIAESLDQPRLKKIKFARPASPEKRGSSSALPPPAPVSPPPAVIDQIRVEKPSKKAKTQSIEGSMSASPAPAPAPPPPAAAADYSLPKPPPDLPPTTRNSMPYRPKRAKELITILKSNPKAFFFLRPVRPIEDGCPDYLREIKQPMDLGTIDKKKYKTMGQFAADIELVFANCRQYNNLTDPISYSAGELEAVYWREWPKAVSPKMTPAEKKDMMKLLDRLLKDDVSYYFRQAVDPIALGIPHYFTIIPRDDARDLSLIKRKLDKTFSTAKQVDDDVEMMLENARVFNGPGEISDAADALGRWWMTQRAKMD